MLMTVERTYFAGVVLSALALCLPGCGGESEKKPAADGNPKTGTTAAADEAPAEEPVDPAPKRKFQAVQLDGAAEASTNTAATKKTVPSEKQAESVVAALQPFQILLGQWKWTTQKKFGGFAKHGEDLEWVWDFKGDRNRPSLTAHSDGNPYFHQVWLTYLPNDDKFQLSLEPEDGAPRVLQGTWAENGEPKEESDGKKTQRTYKLVLEQISPAEGEQWQVTFNQLDNNQYLFELKKRAPAAKTFLALDIVRRRRQRQPRSQVHHLRRTGLDDRQLQRKELPRLLLRLRRRIQRRPRTLAGETGEGGSREEEKRRVTPPPPLSSSQGFTGLLRQNCGTSAAQKHGEPPP
jgi:hypothetical protein